jgi:hypothetical protein
LKAARMWIRNDTKDPFLRPKCIGTLRARSQSKEWDWSVRSGFIWLKTQTSDRPLRTQKYIFQAVLISVL